MKADVHSGQKGRDVNFKEIANGDFYAHGEDLSQAAAVAETRGQRSERGPSI